nr:dash complex subunit dam1 [Quercus suber]
MPRVGAEDGVCPRVSFEGNAPAMDKSTWGTIFEIANPIDTTMASTTPSTAPPSGSAQQRSNSHSRTRSGTIPSRPTTPLRPPSRTSLRASQTTPSGHGSISSADPLASLEPAFAEFSDGMADLEANFMHLQLLNESLGRFNENFGAFLYGMNMSAFCVDFPEAPIAQSFARHHGVPSNAGESPFRDRAPPPDVEATFLTTDTSFVENPPTSTKTAKFSAPPSASGMRQSMLPARSGMRGVRGSGLGRGSSSRGSTAGTGRVASGVGRGRARATKVSRRFSCKLESRGTMIQRHLERGSVLQFLRQPQPPRVSLQAAEFEKSGICKCYHWSR